MIFAFLAFSRGVSDDALEFLCVSSCLYDGIIV